MTKLAFLWTICLVLVLGGVGCTKNNLADVTASITPTQVSITAIPDSGLTSLIAEILKSPNKAGEQVEIIGYFRGWDILDEVDGPPPVTRSDWVIADNSGAIYVTGLMPDDLDPSSPAQVNQIIRLTATVREKGGQVYLEAESAELIKTN
jgi:hypothetical protein